MRYEYFVAYHTANPDGSQTNGQASVIMDGAVTSGQGTINLGIYVRDNIHIPPPLWGWPEGNRPSVVVQNYILLKRWDEQWRPSTSFGAVPSGSMVL